MSTNRKLDEINLRAAVQRTYDAYRTIRMNEKYYGMRLIVLQRCNVVMEMSIALGTSGTIASFAIWNTISGRILIGLIAFTAAILALLKPILGLTQKVEKCSKHWAAYNMIHQTMRRIVEEIQVKRGMDEKMLEAFENTIEQTDRISAGDDPRPIAKWLKTAQSEVNREVPPEILWWPPRRNSGA